MAQKATTASLAHQVAEALARLLHSTMPETVDDDTPLPEAVMPAALHFLEAMRYGGLTEEQYRLQHPTSYLVLLREVEPQHPDIQPAAEPRARRRSRLI